ncbi:MAG: thioredoxin-disulfide reductase [Deltaproteobacteria bacterium]|nr:thioredoxin-disulfide reductase [Deltaproteobacteria bacterium]
MQQEMYDLIIIGGGPAGLTAGMYAARARMKVLLLEKLSPGGQVLNTEWIENYPGFPEGISGFELVDRMKEQALRFGLPIESGEVTGINLSDSEKEVVLADGKRYGCRALVIASGASWNKLKVPGEVELIGKGVSYCATCDGPFFRDAVTAVVGGGDSAVEEALFLTRFAKKVIIIHRRDELRATKIVQERAMASEKIEFLWNTVVTEIQGDGKVERLSLRNVKTGDVSDLEVEGIFIFVGVVPNTGYIGAEIEKDERGFVIANLYRETNVPGVFACGDVTHKDFRQVANAVGEGANACYSAEKYLESH